MRDLADSDADRAVGGSGEKMWHGMEEETFSFTPSLSVLLWHPERQWLCWLPKMLGKASAVLEAASDALQVELEKELVLQNYQLGCRHL